VELRIIQDRCTIQWLYSLDGVLTIKSPYPLGENAECGNDSTPDYLNVSFEYDSANNLGFSGYLNNSLLPTLRFEDSSRSLRIGSFEFITSHSSVLIDYVAIGISTD
jgi:hypothetical protein